MNELSKYLVEQILLEEPTPIKKTIVVYAGRFQPFHKGHYATYSNLVKKFGKDNVYIGTSNKTDNQKSPFNFKEKKTIMTKMFGIPSNKIVEVKNPYAPTEILKNFDENTTGFITVVGEKDEQRLGGKYFEPYKGNVEFGYKDKGYVYASPAQANAISGTDVRNWLSKGTDDEKRKNFLKAYPKFDETIYKFITLKLSKLGEGFPGGVGVGLSLPGGYINGAPKPEDVKKTRKKLDKEDDVNESSKDDIIKDLDKAKNDLLKKVDILIAKKKKLYSNVDIETPMSADEKKLDKDIADLFSQINKLVLQKRNLKESLNEVKWEDDTYTKCMLGKLPLSLNIVKKLVDPIRVVSLHATDIENLPKVAALQGTKKSISTFTQTTKYGKLVKGKGMHTKGGIIVALSGVVLAQSIMDLWTEPDKQGRRWVNPGTIIAGLGREQDVVFNFAPELKKYKQEWLKNMYDKPATNQEKAEFIKKYYDAAEKYMLSKKKEFQDKYLNSNGLYYDSDWNEVVLSEIKIEGILVVPELLKVKTQIGSWTFDREDANETEKIIKQLKQKYKNVVVANTESDIQNFIKNNGGTIKEDINLDVNIGDTLLMGKFKNKKVVVKTIDKDEHGMPTINGKKATTFRIPNKENESIVDEIIKEYSHLLDLLEASSEDEKYTHIGYGKYKLKGQEKDPKSPSFEKDDDGKYVQLKSDEPTGQTDKPQVGAIQGADMFKHAPDVKKKLAKQPKETDWKQDKDGWEILDDDRAKVKNIRDYTDEEYQGETGEYFENDVTKNVAPNAFKDESDMIQKMKDAKPIYLSSEELQNMGNTDVGEILSASEEGGMDSMKARGKELADEYGKDWNRLEKGIAKGNDVPAPIALRDKKGNLHLVAGNTRLMSFTAYGKKLPVKVIDYDGEFNTNAEPKGGGVDLAKYHIKNLKRKISGWAEKEKAFFEQHQDRPKSDERRSWKEALLDKVKGARNAIVHGLKHEVHTFKTAAGGVKNWFAGEDLTEEEKDAMFQVGKKVVIATVIGVATGGLAHGALPFAKHLAMEFVPHIIGETILLGAGKAALFADTNEDERLLLQFMDKIADGLENMPIPPDVMEKAIDSYNKQKSDKIPGGLAKGMSLSDIAKKHNVSNSEIVDEFKKGYKVEREHTTDSDIAKEIAMDHLFEDPKYYTKLALVEISASGDGTMGGFFNDGNSTTGYAWNSDWNDYDDQDYYLDNLEGWSNVHEKPSEYEKKKATDQTLPIDGHDDGKTSKYNRILKYGYKEPAEFLKNADVKLTEGLLNEGGAYGHMNHPFDTDINLTFGQLKNIVNLALEGELDLAREKTDGQALAISWVGGRLVAARNKSHLKNKGAGALDIKGVADKFSGRGELEKAYNFAMQDLTTAIKSLSEPQRKKIFKDGSCFMNLEVIYPTSVNVIPYGQPLLVFHGTMEYDVDGNAIGENQQAAKILAGMIKQVNKDVQSVYTIQGPPVLSLPKSQKLSAQKPKFLGKIQKLQKEFGLSDTDGVADYHQAWWNNFVTKKSPSMLDNKTQMGLVKRWAFGDKGFRIDKNSITDEKTLEWAQKIDKEDQSKITKDNLMKFEDIFLGVGAEVLQFTSSVLTVNPDSAVREMKKRLDQTVKDVQKSGDPKKIEKLKLELKRLTSIGGPNKIVPIEGIVFVYGGKTFKLTGAFASLNQLLGIFYA